MKTLAEILPALSAQQRDIENWIERLELRTKIPPTVQGRARTFTRENALELAFIAALVSGGAKPSVAVLFAESFIRSVKHSISRKTKRWFVFPGGRLDQGLGYETLPDLDETMKKLGTASLSVINLHSIVTRVDSVFQKELVGVS